MFSPRLALTEAEDGNRFQYPRDCDAANALPCYGNVTHYYDADNDGEQDDPFFVYEDVSQEERGHRPSRVPGPGAQFSELPYVVFDVGDCKGIGCRYYDGLHVESISANRAVDYLFYPEGTYTAEWTVRNGVLGPYADVPQLSYYIESTRGEFVEGTLDIVTNASAQLTFEYYRPRLLSIILGGDGAGRVTSSPSGIDFQGGPAGFSGICSALFPYGSTVMLNVVADESSTFVGWTGTDCGTSVAMGGARSCTATLAAPAQSAEGNVTVIVNRVGKVNSTPEGISGSDCKLVLIL